MIATLNRQPLSHAGKRILILLDGDYGSLQTERLAKLEGRLEQAAQSSRGSKIEVDLSYAKGYGAGLVNVLLRGARTVREMGGQFRVVGDHGGVLKMLRLEGMLGKF